MVARSIDEGTWSDVERALLSVADELHNDCDVSDTTWARLAEHYDESALVEILFFGGPYTRLSMVANAAGIPAGPSVRRSSPGVSAALPTCAPCARWVSKCPRSWGRYPPR